MSYPKNKVANPAENKTLSTRVYPAKDGHDLHTSILPKSGSEPSDQVTCRLGDSSCARAHASTLERSSGLHLNRKTQAVLNLQRDYGNKFVGQVIQSSREDSQAHSAPGVETVSTGQPGSIQMEGDGADGSRDVEASIERTRGGGQALDSAVQAQMGKAFNADFSAVRVHTGTEAGALNQSLNARAFTTGKDIYFRQGEYRPGTSSGRELLAHELTHVVQQNGDEIQTKKDPSPGEKPIFRKLTVSSPGDIYEQEADRVATAVSRREQMPVTANEEEKEKEMVATKQLGDHLSCQEEEEEEPVQKKLDQSGLQLQPEEEEMEK